MNDEKETGITIISSETEASKSKVAVTGLSKSLVLNGIMGGFGSESCIGFPRRVADIERDVNEATYGPKRGMLVTLFPGIKL